MADYKDPRPSPTASAADPCVIYDNAVSFNNVLNTDSTVTTYTGKELLTLSQAIDKFGFGVAPFTFTVGGTLDSLNLLISNSPTDGFLYKYVGVGPAPIVVTAGTDPTISADWQAFAATSLQTLSGLTAPSDLAQRHRIKTTAAEIATGVFNDGDLLEVSDIANAPFDVVIGASANGYDVLYAGLGKIAVLVRDSGSVYTSDLGGASSEALNLAVDLLDTGNQTITGGKIEIPIGSFSVNGTIIITNSEAERLAGISISGKGKQGTTLDFSGSPVGTGLSFGGVFNALSDIAVKNANGNAVELVIDNAKAWNHFSARRARVGFSSGHSFSAQQGFMGHFDQVFATNALSGFDGFHFDGLHTSLHFDNCYAASNSVNGYHLNRTYYSAMTACASDSNGQHGYRFQNSHSLKVSGCGAESNGRAGFYSVSSTGIGANFVSLDSCFGFQNNKSGAGFANLLHMVALDGVSNKAVLRSSKSQSPFIAISDVIVDGKGAYLVDEDNDLPNGVRAQNLGYIHHVNRTKVLHNVSVAGGTNLVELANPQGHQTDFAGIITVVATNSAPDSISVKNNSCYQLMVLKGLGGTVGITEIAKMGQTTGAGASSPSFTFDLVGNFLFVTPVANTSGNFSFEILCNGPSVKVK